MTPSMLFLACIVVLVLIQVALEIEHRKEFNERFPAIPDEGFLARCPPGTNRRIALKVRRSLSQGLGVDYERIYPTSRIVEDLGAD